MITRINDRLTHPIRLAQTVASYPTTKWTHESLSIPLDTCLPVMSKHLNGPRAAPDNFSNASEPKDDRRSLALSQEPTGHPEKYS